jgi:predicted glycoside hydrolase/deacetylase ChbG (UPF0249 family)
MPAPSKKIFITLDDFGISQVANERMLTLIRLGDRIDRIAVMMNGSFSDAQRDELLRSGIKIDIHLDASETINPTRKLKEGALLRILVFLWRFLRGESGPSRVRAIWEQQIQDFHTRFGRYPDGLNSHQHVHYFPPYFRVFTGLAQKYHIPTVRFGTHFTANATSVAFVLNTLRLIDQYLFPAKHLTTTTLMLSGDWLHSFDTLSIQQKLRPGQQAEIIFHPERDEEYTFLKDVYHPKEA